jgi:uncharacterized membrane protein
MFAIDDFYTNFIFVLRWIHILAGIIWIGHLYFFNFVNVPFQGVLEKEYKSKVNPFLLPRALWWFRWGAMITFLAGVTLLLVKYSVGQLWTDPVTGTMSHRTMWILWGATLGTIMWFNVWFIIWPAQKQLIRWLRDGQSPPEMPALAKKALFFSRLNTYLSGPMLFAMIAPNNYGAMSAGTLLFTIVVGAGTIWGLIKMSPKVGTSI